MKEIYLHVGQVWESKLNTQLKVTKLTTNAVYYINLVNSIGEVSAPMSHFKDWIVDYKCILRSGKEIEPITFKRKLR
tara:strand:- start:267 stop:497 length:231 start_codon:yes stop_codon:yes gene_type:complete